MKLADRFTRDDYALIAGPPTLTAPVPSFDVQEIADYAAAEVLATLLGLPGVRQISEGGRHWQGWEAAWKSEDRLILFERVEELDDAGHFGEVRLRCDCLVSDLLRVWESLRARHPGLWLYSPDSWLLTPAAFLDQ